MALMLLAAGAAPSPAFGQSPGGGSGPATASARSPAPYVYYRPDVDFGSEAVQGPLAVVANRGLSNLFYGRRFRAVFDVAWGERFDAVGRVLGSPLQAVEDVGGWGTLVRREILADTWTVWEWGWTSNYAGHVVAGGLTYRYLREWMDHRGVPLPTLLAAGTVWGANLLNEAVERPVHPKERANSLMDMVLFEPLGMLLMSHDGIARFFTRTLRAADWSPQASLTLPAGRVQNVAQVMTYKVPLPLLKETRALVAVGLLFQAGLIHPAGAGGHHIGWTFGVTGHSRTVDPETGRERWKAGLGGALYVDRDNSLLASVSVNEIGYETLQVNVYPGVLPEPLRWMGMWVTRNRDGLWSFGVSTPRTLGLGLGWDLGPSSLR